MRKVAGRKHVAGYSSSAIDRRYVLDEARCGRRRRLISSRTTRLVATSECVAEQHGALSGVTETCRV